MSQKHSVNHEWLLKCMEYYRVPSEIIQVLKEMMNKWTIQLIINRERIGNIRIKTGILQGDSLSPLLFILAIDVISKQLEKKITTNQNKRK